MNMLKGFSLVCFSFLVACAGPQSSFQIDELKQTQPSAQRSPLNSDKSTVTALQQIIPSTTASEASIKKADKINTSNSTGSVPSSWDLSGAMAARSKNKAWTASINWLQRGAGTYQIRLFGPLGSGAILIEKKGSLITFRDGPKSSSSTNAEALLSQQTGIRLPVNNLYYWVRGIPAPGAVQSVKRDGSNRLQVLKQAGYTIEYLGYANIGASALPSQIRLQGNGVFIKLAIKRWKI